jgi:hypothetical protein
LVKKALWAVALASGLALISSINGLAGSPVLVTTGGSPLAGCSTDGQIGTNYLSAEVEPQLAVSGHKMIAQWHQDRWSNGGGRGIGVGVSTNGGVSWADSVMPWDQCTTADPLLAKYLRNSDPWVSFGPDGTAYASALAFNLAVPDWSNAVVVATLPKGSASWQYAQAIRGSVFTQFAQSTDKNSTTADPKHAGVAYTVWDTLIEPTDNPDDNPHTSSYTGPAYFSKTTDGGKSWSTAQIIINTNQRQQTIGNVIVVDPNLGPMGTLFDFTDLIVSPNTPKQGTRSNDLLAFVKSTDGGTTWTAPQVIAPFNSLGVHDPNTGQLLRVGDGLAEVAIDANGKLYAVWESSTNYDKSLNQSAGAWDDEILLTSSSDHGMTWSTPAVVHHLDSGLPTYTPTVAVNGGRVAVTYYDNRNLSPTQKANLPTDYWVSYSTDGGVTFPKALEQHIVGPFDQLTAPNARGFFLGDYEGLQPSGGGFAALFVKTNCDATDSTGQNFPSGGACAPADTGSNLNPTDVFFASLS